MAVERGLDFCLTQFLDATGRSLLSKAADSVHRNSARRAEAVEAVRPAIHPFDGEVTRRALRNRRKRERSGDESLIRRGLLFILPMDWGRNGETY